MTESACPLAHSDAAYVLGSLSPTDRLEFERHLPGCERCRRSVAELAGLPGLLGRVPREQVESPLPFEPPPATLLPALVAAVRREQRRKTVLVTLGAAAAIAAVALGVGALQAARDDGPRPRRSAASSSPAARRLRPERCRWRCVSDYGVHADVSLTARVVGHERGAGSAATPSARTTTASGHAYRYSLVVFTEDGEPEQVDELAGGARATRSRLPEPAPPAGRHHEGRAAERARPRILRLDL